MKLSRRVLDTPPYLFHRIDEKRKAAQQRGVDVISLAIGDPDQPTPGFVLELMHQEINDPRNHVYPSYKGEPDFCKSVADWFGTRFGVGLDPATEVMAVIDPRTRSLIFLSPSLILETTARHRSWIPGVRSGHGLRART